MKAIGVIGYSNAGKTTLIERLIPRLRARGLAVAAIKNAHHGFDMDRPGKDSYRYRSAGAGQVLIATGLRWALLTETPAVAASLEDLLGKLAPCDIVIIEGFKSEGRIPRIEVRRLSSTEPSLFPHDPNVIAIAADVPVPEAAVRGLPVLDLNDVANIEAFVVHHLEL
jgi:molybdopterin-guanine dinucleotide biosynthesis protein B